jgi:hypothetical protein
MPLYALRTVDDLRQLNQFYFYAPAQDSVQRTGVFGEIAIGCGRQRKGARAGEGSWWSLGLAAATRKNSGNGAYGDGSVLRSTNQAGASR